MPFRCSYCGGYFCSEHRLPEMHDCPGNYRYSRSTVGQGPSRPIGSSYSFTPQRRGGFGFSRKELKDLSIGLAVILTIPFASQWRLLFSRPTLIIGVAVIFGLAFILHEIAHKFVAQRFGYWAEFRINRQGLMITLLSLISPFKIIAPGAVMIGGSMNLKDYGKISIAGPLTNIGLGIVFMVIGFFTRSNTAAFLAVIGMNINASLALFNLIPFGLFDGAKIIRWNKVAWAAAVVAALGLYVFS